jgi:hypothetical protein
VTEADACERHADIVSIRDAARRRHRRIVRRDLAIVDPDRDGCAAGASAVRGGDIPGAVKPRGPCRRCDSYSQEKEDSDGDDKFAKVVRDVHQLLDVGTVTQHFRIECDWNHIADSER